MYIILLINLVHLPGIDEDQHNEDVDGSLLGEPESQSEPEKPELIEKIYQQDSAAE
jgi:hypothetical protein